MERAVNGVSVIIPTVGRPELRNALESVRNQSMQCAETIVVLDRPDAEPAVREILLPSERLVVTPGAAGGGGARALGLSASVGGYVAFLDDDDWWEPKKVEAQVTSIQSSGATFSSTATYFDTARGVRILPEEELQPSESIASYLVRRPRLRHGSGYIQTSSLMVRADLAKAVSWNPSLRKHQDWDFIVRCAEHPDFKYSFINVPLVHVVQGSAGSVSKLADWSTSSKWYDEHRHSLDRAAAGDFVLTQVIRGSLSGLDARGLRHGVALLKGTRPHFAAIVVGLFGAVEGVQNRWGKK
ncbi:glycosyltransferase family 2 protein [Rhodococcus sp. 2G]|uniref:glycosyltransferase family 2 protein n=1 Tax=Rhodococcus sp. 2G TaxID=1570939 RepID=UPI000A8DE387|nr:glycosyltransferase [Rhodococcus sp. 2G]